jgi:steroid 5-alpha reductase family enzyme
MLFDFKRPARGRRYSSSVRNEVIRTREYYYSLFTTLVVKIILFIFLWMLFASSVRVMRKSFRSISEAWRLALPGAVAAIAILIGYHIYKNIKEILRYNKELEEVRKTNRRM